MSDNGPQFTSTGFEEYLQQNNIPYSELEDLTGRMLDEFTFSKCLVEERLANE